jgi:cytochrome o ubiquinol oxidase subunit 1
MLHERLGRYAFWSWIVGFVLAFIPLYLLGLMGMTRRLSQVDPAWHSLLLVAALGACVIALGIFFQVLQMVVSIWQRNEHRDVTGDPWNGRTLEWSTASPPPFYNFAVIPEVEGRDAWWMRRQKGASARPAHYEDIEIPKNTVAGALIAAGAFLLGFGMVWHIWWLAAAGAVGAAVFAIVRSFEEETEYTLPAAEVARMEAARTSI